MNWIKKRYDQFLLVLVAVLLLAFSVMLIMRARAFEETFAGIRGEVVQSREIDGIDVSRIERAQVALGNPPAWSTEVKGSLLVAKKYIIKDGRPISPLDDPNAPLIHPPVENQWFEKHNLDILSTGVLQDDPDQDGFFNLDEWRGKTDPNDKLAHPPYHTKLRLKLFRKQAFRLLFNAYNGNPTVPSTLTFQINTLDVRQPTQFLKLDDRIAGTKFKITGFEHKSFTDPNNVQKDISELTIQNVETQANMMLVLERIVDSPDSYAILSYIWGGGSEIQVKKDGVFKLPPDDIEYKLIDISETGAVIQNVKTDEKLPIRKGE